MSHWREAYLLYRSLESDWLRWHADYLTSDDSLNMLKDFVQHSWDDQVKRYQESNLQLPDAELTEKILAFKSILNKAGDPSLGNVKWYFDETFEDAYQAGLYLLIQPTFWRGDGDFAYRGQQKNWKVQPAISVCPPGSLEMTSEELDQRIDRVAWIMEEMEKSSEIATQIPTDEQRIAVAQHYGVATWLLDVTSNPLVALFFASLNGQSGDVGVLMQFGTHEWEDLSAGGQNRLGRIKVIQVPGVRRLQVQEAFFIQAAHPELIEQYIPFTIRFHQRSGLLFEDPSKGITKDLLLDSAGDRIADFVVQHKVRPEHSHHETERKLKRPVSGEPTLASFRSLTALNYQEMIESWIAVNFRHWFGKARMSEREQRLVIQLCSFHVELQSRREQISPSARSITSFYRSVKEALALAESSEISVDFKGIVETNYISHARPDQKTLLYVIADQIS